MFPSSKYLAKSWPYPRQRQYEDLLRGAAAQWFAARGMTTHPKYPYSLLQLDQWQQNIILPEVAAFIRHEQVIHKGVDAFPLHKFLHHGLSSQAMLFNLVGPLLVRSDLRPLQHAFEGAGVPWPDGSVAVQLEISDRRVFNEDTGQPTSIDFAVHGAAGSAPLFVEAKFTEKEFGGCSVFAGGDCEGRNPAADLPSCYLHHIGRTYWQRAQEHGLLDSPLAAGSICPFASYYQFFRESLFALHQSGHFVLLCDARSPVFFRRDAHDGAARGLWPFLTAQVPETMRRRLHAVTIQQVVAAIEASGRHEDWIGEFKLKYGMVA